jgi:beta-glucuronidase
VVVLRPQQSTTRELVSLNGLWRFALEDAARPEPWLTTLDSDIEMPVPSSYNDVRVDLDLRHHVGAVWYQRQVRVPRGWAGERIVVRFDAATHEAAVYVDDELVTTHAGGYTPFEVDITERVRAGEQFRLSVAVRNVLTSGTVPPGEVREDADGTRRQTYLHDFFNYAGLARSVWLYSTPAAPIRDVDVVTGVEGSTGIVRYEVTRDGTAAVRARLRDAAGAVVAEATGDSGELRIAEVNLWQPGAAYLYDLAVELLDGERVVDEYVLPIGIRTVEVRGTELLINGSPFYFRGFGMHEDNIARGKGHDDVMMVHDFSLLAWSGANSLRTSHYPYAEEVLDYADRHGFVVIDETAAVGLNLNIGAGMGIPSTRPTFSEQTFGSATQAAHAQHLTELIDRDRHHPSVVMWCITNEPASDEEGAREYFAPLVELARKLDPSRPLTYANLEFASSTKDRIADLFDVICLNRYYGWYNSTGDLAAAEAKLEAELNAWADKFGKPLIITEYGADAVAGLHSAFDQAWTEDYQADLLETYHRVFDRVPAVIGEQVWNFADFQTSSTVFRVDGNKKGVFTRDRRPKAGARVLRRRWLGRED